jgi:tetratricopeptide (TPR) repeat protein
MPQHLSLCAALLLWCCSQEEPSPEPLPAAPLAEQGRQLFAAGQYAETIALLAQTPPDQQTAVLLARAHLALGQHEEARQRAEAALNSGPPSAELCDLLGAAHMAGAFAQARYTDTDSAIAAFSRALVLDPRRASSLYNLGLLHGYRDSTALAERYYRAALEADSTLAAAHKKLGQLYRHRGDLELALAQMQRAVRFAPGDAEAHFNLALLHRERNELGAALASFEEAARLNPHSPQVFLNLAGTYLRLGRRPEGEEALRRSEILRQYDRGIGSERSAPAGASVAIGPSTARYNMALNHALRGEYSQAALEYRNALQLNPQLRDAHAGLGIALYLQGELGEAADAFRRAVDLDSADAVSQTRLGLIYLKQGQYALARAALEQAARADTALPEAAYGLGLLSARTQDLRGAIAHFSRALALHPGYAEASLNLGVAHMRLGEYALAARAYEQGVEADPANPRARLYLSDAYAKLGQSEESRAQRERARHLNQGKESP